MRLECSAHKCVPVLLRCVLLQIWDVTKLKRTRTMGGH
jgi:hypothetical protein